MQPVWVRLSLPNESIVICCFLVDAAAIIKSLSNDGMYVDAFLSIAYDSFLSADHGGMPLLMKLEVRILGESLL